MRLLRKKAGKLLAVIFLCTTAALLTGCGASLTVYDYSQNGIRYNAYELKIDRDTVDAMEKTAALDDDGNKYTVEDYFFQLFANFGYEPEYAQLTDEAYTVRYVRAISGKSDLDQIGSAVEFKTEHTENPFVRYYTATSPNPFNGVREAYDNVESGQSSTVLERLKNGIVARNEYGDRVVLFPAVCDAFPYLKQLDEDGLLLNYIRTGSKRMNASGSSYEIDDDNAQFVFSRYFDRTDSEMIFEYKRPVPYGWYLTALAAGGIVLGIIALVTRTKKQKPTLLDRFPYNPEEYRDYESHLPTKR